MAEWVRIFSNRIWLGAAVLLLLCNLGLYAREQSSQAGGSVHAYSEYTNQWMQALSEVSPEEGLALLEQENQTLQGWNAARLLAQMEAGQGQVDDELLSRYRTQYDNFDAMFQAVRDGTAPAQDIAAQKAVTRWMDRLTYQMNYDEFLSSISSQADVIRRNPLFSDPHTFVYRNADKTETDYLSTRDAALKLQPGDVVTSIMKNRTSVIFSLCLMVVSITLILEPKRLGLETLERSCINGRCAVTGWRIGAIAMSAAIAAFLMQGGMLLLGTLLYRQPLFLDAPAQSILFFQRWAAPATVGGVLLWYFLFSAAGLCAVGLLLWLALSKLPSLPLGLTVYGAILLLEFYWLKQYDVNDALYPLSGFNIFRLLLPAEAAGRYLNYDLLGFPVRERTLLLAVSAVLIFACAAAALISAHFSRGTRQNGAVFKVLPRRGRSKRAYLSRHPKSVLVYEWQKLLLYCGGVLFLGVCGVLLMSQTPPPAASNMQQVQLAQYISTYTGPVDEAVLVQIRSVRQEEKQIYAESLEDDSKAAFWEYYAARCWALDELCARYEELLDMQAAGHDDLQLLDDQPFERIYGGSGTDFRLVSACVSLLALCLTIPGVFWLERNHGMELLLHSTAAGRTRLWRWKAVLALCVSIGIWLIWSGYELFQFRSLGGSWDACPANADSLFYWDSHLGSTPLLVYLIGFYAFRLVGLLSAASVTLWISSRLPAMLPAAGISALVLLVPVLLTQLGAPSLEYVSWAAKLAGDGLAVRWADVLCFGVWTVLGITALVASRHQWLRYRG